LEIEYPAVTDETRTLIDVISIEYIDESLDQINLGDITLGFVQEDSAGSSGDHVYEFYPANEVNKPYPAKKTYGEVWQDILIHIANDLDYAVEFTVRVSNKLEDGK
jgi:hypothetical protein